MMKNFSVLIFLMICIGIHSNGQIVTAAEFDQQSSAQSPSSALTTHRSPLTKYWIFFSDKNNSPFSVNRPSEFLTDASLERRRLKNIPVYERDMPVNPTYVESVKQTGAEVVVESRWMNGVSVYATDEQIAFISGLSFVKQIDIVKRYKMPDDEIVMQDQTVFYKTTESTEDYGGSENQNTMIRVDYLHDLGFSGEGLRIAVLDAGFSGVDTGVGFQSFWDKGQILLTKNFPDDNPMVFFSSSHGSNVLSIMGADVPGTYIGSAPDAQFYLFRTEISDSENVVEEDHWLEAAEYAEFLGAHIINSSLGYTTFDNVVDDHSYADMDGNTTVVTNAADWAASVGILVCNSAGNEGNDVWKYIGAPADGDSVFTIGSVDKNEVPSDFSSTGPTSDGRLKPNVVAQGEGARVLDKSGYVYEGSGTSYSSPLMAGACASLWQAFPEATNMQIIDAVQKSADHYYNPNNKIGYGVPDFSIAFELLQDNTSETELLSSYPNPASDHAIIVVNPTDDGDATITLYDITGQFIRDYILTLEAGISTKFVLNNIENLPSGMYMIVLATGDITSTSMLMIN